MWTTERPTEAGFYFFRHAPFATRDQIGVKRYRHRYNGSPLVDDDGYTAEYTLRTWPEAEWLRIPSPARLAALERLAEAAIEHKEIVDQMSDFEDDDVTEWSVRFNDSNERYEAALDAVREAK